MASAFGIAGLKSKLDDWRSSRKNAVPEAHMNQPVAGQPLTPTPEGGSEIDLSFLLENLVIPKLVAERDNRGDWLRSSDTSDVHKPADKQSVSLNDIDEFTRLAVDGDAETLLDFVDNCLAAGNSVETIYVDLLAPAARKLGELWEEDSEDFVGVTMGLWRIQEILRELAVRVPPQSQPGHGQRIALFSSMPGEQHSLGTLMVAECFERAGWETEVLIEPSRSELTARFAKHRFDLIGLTVSCDCPTESITSLVKAIRAVSHNPNIQILLGGRVINEQPHIVNECGADGTANDATSAIAIANRLVPVTAAGSLPPLI